MYEKIKKIRLKSFLITIFFTFISRLGKISFILGSRAAFFSVSNFIAPMVGIIGGINYGIGLYITQSLIKFILGGSLIYCLLYHISHLFASAYWLSSSKIIRIIAPATCIALFLIHPVGVNAWVYSIFWIIPIIISLKGHNNIILRALGTTFTGHAIGSVLWLYTGTLTSQMWIALIPITIVERIAFASAMVGIYYCSIYIKNYLSNHEASAHTILLKK